MPATEALLLSLIASSVDAINAGTCATVGAAERLKDWHLLGKIFVDVINTVC